MSCRKAGWSKNKQMQALGSRWKVFCHPRTRKESLPLRFLLLDFPIKETADRKELPVKAKEVQARDLSRLSPHLGG